MSAVAHCRDNATSALRRSRRRALARSLSNNEGKSVSKGILRINITR